MSDKGETVERGGDDPEGISAEPGSLLDELGVAAFVLDGEGRIAFWGPEAEHLLGYRAADVLGRPAGRVLIAPEHLPLVTEWFERVRDGAAWAGIFPVRRADGSMTEVEFRHRRLLDPHGQVHVLGLAADAGTVRRLETDLALSNSLITQSPVGLALFDEDFRWMRVNPALERINGLPASQLLGRPMGEVFTGVDVPTTEEALRRVRETGEPLTDQQITGRTPADPDHDHVWSASFYRVEDGAGRTLGTAVSVIDVTERHRVASEIAEAREQLSMIAEASSRIGTTLDLGRTAQELADVIVPRLADLAAVDVLDSVCRGEVEPPLNAGDAARFRALALASAPGTEASAAADQVGELAVYGPHRAITRCVAEARPIPLPQVGPDILRSIARDAAAARVLEEPGCTPTWRCRWSPAARSSAPSASAAPAPPSAPSTPATWRWRGSSPRARPSASTTPASTAGSGTPPSPCNAVCCPGCRTGRSPWSSPAATCRRSGRSAGTGST